MEDRRWVAWMALGVYFKGYALNREPFAAKQIFIRYALF